ncbi:hypothetical protein EIP86_005045 [Pleurotus ostreatoroseus]|nr:hypothetical protein EIP86_005045 [Pleurotus ostreatoroseus]
MVLRLPKTLLDASLLEDEPFKKCFADCEKQHTQRRRRSTARSSHVEQVVKALSEEGSHGLDAPILWITNAFSVSPTEAKEARLLGVFVEFYWHLYHRSEREALDVMRKECKEREMGYTPEVDSLLTPVINTVTVKAAENAQASSSRKKRRKQGREHKNDGTDKDDGLDDYMLLSNAHISTTSTGKPQLAKAVAASVTREGSQTKAAHKQPPTKSSESHSVDSPLSSLSDSESDISLLIKTRGKKRKSRKHGASSPSATSANDTPIETKSTLTAKGPCDDISDSSLTEVSSDEQSPQEKDSTPSAVNAATSTAGQAPTVVYSEDPKGVPTIAGESISTAIPNSEQVLSAVAAVGPSPNTPESPTSTLVTSPPTNKGRRRKTQRGLEPTRVMPSRRAAHKEALSELVMKETHYQKLAQRGRYEDLEAELSPPSTRAPQEKSGEDPSVATAKKGGTVSVESGRALRTGTKPSPQSAAIPSKLVSGRKTVKKPRILPQSSGISTQVAKKQRRNDGTAAHLPIGAALADVMMHSMSASAAAVKAPSATQPEASAVHVQNEKPEQPAEVPTREASVAGAQSATKARKPKRGRKRKQTQIEAQAEVQAHAQVEAQAEADTEVQDEAQANTQQDATPVSRSVDTRLTIRIPRRGRRACPSAPIPEYRPPVDSSVVGAVLRDAGTAALQSLTCTVKPADSWEVEKVNEDPPLVYESDHNDEDFVLEDKASARKSTPQNRPIVLHASEPDDLPTRPPLERYPPIWAESRQEVCESFDWFRSYQGGVYFVKGYVKGYLLGGFSASRDVFHNNGKLIISHGGGKAESIHKLNGQSETIEASDQMEDDKSVRALLHTYRIKRPLVLLIDDKYKLFPFDIAYSEGFLAPVAFHEERMEQLSPSLPGLNLPTDGITTSRHFTKGWHCQKCGRLSSRFKWEFWECRNCGERHGEYGKLRIAAEFKQQKPTKSFDRHWSHKSRGTLLTNYFSQNKHPKYVGGDANTVPFDRAPSAVVQALELIKQRMEEAELSEVGFNEVLSAAYMEEQRMAFHSDSERGLGPTVASLSLGAAAYMHFRLHARYAAEEMPEDSSRDVLKLFLRHGDVVVMEGAGVQTFYE